MSACFQDSAVGLRQTWWLAQAFTLRDAAANTISLSVALRPGRTHSSFLAGPKPDLPVLGAWMGRCMEVGTKL